MLLIQQCMIHPMTGQAAWQGDVLIDHGTILRLEPHLDPATQRPETVLDARGLHLWPGLIDAHTHLGLTEDQTVQADPGDPAFAQAAAAGVTLVEVCPAPAVPAPRKCTLWHTGRTPARLAQPGSLLLPLRGLSTAELEQAAAEAAQSGRQLRLTVCTEAELRQALPFCREDPEHRVLEYRLPLAACLDDLARSGVVCIISAARHQGQENAYALAARLMNLGASVALSTEHPMARIHHLALCAGLCLRHGAREEDAMAAVTRTAARALGLGSSHGRIAPGYAADLTLLDGSPLRLATAVRCTIVDGRIIYQR